MLIALLLGSMASVAAARNTLTVVSGANQTASPGATLDPIVIEYRDEKGSPAAGRLTYQILSGDAQVEDRFVSVASTDPLTGRAAATVKLGATESDVVVRVSDGDSKSPVDVALFSRADATAPGVRGLPPPTLTITGGNNQTGAPNSTLPDPLTVQLLDGNGRPVQGASVFYQVQSSNATFVGGNGSSLFTSTDSSGIATATMILGPTPGAVVATVDANGLRVTFNETIGLPVPPTVTYNPPAGSGFALSQDGSTAFGNVTATPSGGSGTGPAATTVVDNCSFAPNSANFTVGGQPLSFEGSTTQSQSLFLTCQVGASDVTARLTCSETQGTAPPQTRFFDVTCPADPFFPVLSLVSGDGQSGPPDSTLPQPLVAMVADPQGNPISDAQVYFRINSGAAGLQPVGGGPPQPVISLGTNSQGRAAVEIVLGSTEGPVVGEVALDSDFETPIPFTATIVSEPSTITLVSGNNQSGGPGTDSAPLVVRLNDGQGAPLANTAVTFALQSGSGALLTASGALVSQITLNTNAQGQASILFRYGNEAGPVVIDASAPGIGSVTFNLEVIGAGEGDSLRAVSGNGQTGASGTLSQPLVVELLRGGSPSSGETINWFVRSGDAQVENFATTTGPDGRSSNRITFGNTEGPIVIEARTGDGLLSVQFNLNTSNSALQIRLVSGGGQAGGVNAPFAQPLVFEVANGFGVVQSGVVVTFAVAQGSAVLNAASATTDASGRVSVTGIFGPNAGPVRISATIGSGGPTPQSAFADLTSFTPGLRIVSGDNQTAAPGTTLPAPLVVEATQPPGAGGKVGGIVLRWTVIEGGGSVASATTTTDAAGRASNTFTLGPQPGTHRVRVDADGGGSVTFVATASTPPPTSTARLEIVSGNNQDLATNTDSAPLVVRVVDATTGAPLGNVCVNFSSPTPGVSVALAQSASTSAGLAQTTARLNDIGPAIVAALICGSGTGQVNFALNGAIENTLGLEPGDRAFPISQAFDRACPSLRDLQAGGTALNPGQADLLARCEDFEFAAGNDPDGVIDALEQLLTDNADAQNIAALTIAAAQFDNLKARIAALRSGTNGASFGGLALQGSNGSVPLSFAPTALNATEDPATEVGSGFDRWGFFATGTLGDGDRDADGDNAGFDFETRGITAGVDYRYSDSLIFGAAIGYANSDTDISGGGGELEAKGFSISGYTTFYQGDSWYADGVLTYGSNSYDISRAVQFTLQSPGGSTTTVDQVNSASPDGSQFSAAFTAGRDFQRGAWSLGPFLRWQFTSVDFDSFTETVSTPGAPGVGLAVTVDEREVESVQAVLGGKASYAMSTTWGILIPHFQLEYVHEFKDDPDALTSRLVFDPTNTVISVSGRDVDQSFLNLGLGVSAIFANGRSAFLYYEKLLGQEDTSKDSLAIGIRIEF